MNKEIETKTKAKRNIAGLRKAKANELLLEIRQKIKRLKHRYILNPELDELESLLR